MKKVCDFFKSNKKLMIIIGAVLALLIIGLVLCLIVFNNNDEKTSSKKEVKTKEEEVVEDKLVAPAENTETLVDTLTRISAQNVSSNEIIFSNDVALEEGEKVAVWLYSEPKFLGYFEVVIKDGVKKIEGLAKALESITIEKGKHHIAVVTEKGAEIGYVDVYMNDDGLSKNEIKEVAEKETINFNTTVQNELNMKKGTKQVVQSGAKGEKTVTYKVTYDENGNELSREKIKEDIIKNPVEQIEKVGTSDYNLNTDMLTEVSFGPACTESQIMVDDYGYKECDSLNNPNLPEYYAVKINTTYYITSIKEGGVEKLSSPIKVTGTDSVLLKASYKGMQYYFYMSAGGGQYEPLTSEMCSQYKLSCGAW